MLNGPNMTLVNLLVLFFLATIIFIYKYIFPKRKIKLYVFLVLLLILPVISVFRIGTYESGDFNIHIYRLVSFYASLSEGNLMPSWAGLLNATFGYPLFIMNYPLPYYLLSLIHFLGFGLIFSMKIFLASNFIVAGIGMYFLGKYLFKNNLAAFTAAIFYAFSPYHLVDIHYKVALGEILSFTLLPFFFLSFINLYDSKKPYLIFLSAFTLAFLILSHIIIAVFAVVLLFCYLVFSKLKSRNVVTLWQVFLASSIAGILSLYSWSAPILLKQYTVLGITEQKTVGFPTIGELLYSPWRMGLLFQGPTGEISHLIGYTHLISVGIAVFLLFSKNSIGKNRQHLIFWTIAFFALVFLITPHSKFIWANIHIISAVGSQRLLVLVALTTSILAGYLMIILKKRKYVIYTLIFLTIVSSILNWAHRRVIPEINDSVLISRVPLSTASVEGHYYAATRWVDPDVRWFAKIPDTPINIIEGEGTYKKISHNSTKYEYVVHAYTLLNVIQNTTYFPGWSAYINGRSIPIKPTSAGTITFNIPPGLWYMQVVYKDIPILQLLKTVSLVVFTLNIFLFILFWKKSKLRSKKY